MQSSTKRSMSIIATEYLRELESEVRATRECLEQVPMDQPDWKPHEKSMPLNYLAMMVAEIPKWITYIIEKSVIDFATFQHIQPTTTAELVKQHDENLKGALNALKKVSNEELENPFYLKNQGQVLFTSSKKANVSSSINHLVHHRGQLTVYLRLNNIAVPSIYGPSADDQNYQVPR